MKHGLLSTPADRTGERRLVEAIRARVPADPGWLSVGIGDDAAVAAPERGALEVFTTDSLVEAVHFDLRFSSLADVGWKALAVNLSDIAAMGATPRLALLSLVLPDEHPRSAVDAILDGFLELAANARVALAGGNLARSPGASGAERPGPIVVDVTVAGFVRPRRVLVRGGARPGDEIYVSGTLGAAAAGLMALRAGDASESLGACIQRHRRPAPQLRLGALLGRNRAASACMDLSDGLADGVRQICEMSRVGAAIDAGAIPIDAGPQAWFARHGIDPLAAAIGGGDDYELLFTVPRRSRGRLATVVRQAQGVGITRIGEVTRERDIVLRRDGRDEPLPSGFSHFAKD